MEEVVVMKIPILNGDLVAIQDCLMETDIFCGPPHLAFEQLYDVSTYLKGSIFRRESSLFLVDRNIFSSLISIAQGEEVKERHQLAAAALAFIQTSEGLIEPNMAVYEYGEVDSEKAAEEVHWFRRLDNTHPQIMADIALGRSQVFESDLLAEAQGDKYDDVDFSIKPTGWNRCYIALLKIALLELQRDAPKKKLERLIDWMADEYLFVSGALRFASIYWAPNARMSGMLKSLRSPDRQKALKGIGNATRDLLLVSDFAKRVVDQTSTEELTILVSADKALLQLARGLLTAETETDAVHRQLAEEWRARWGDRRGTHLAEHYLCARDRAIAARRQGRRRKFTPEQIVELRERLEEMVRRWERGKKAR